MAVGGGREFGGGVGSGTTTNDVRCTVKEGPGPGLARGLLGDEYFRRSGYVMPLQRRPPSQFGHRRGGAVGRDPATIGPADDVPPELPAGSLASGSSSRNGQRTREPTDAWCRSSESAGSTCKTWPSKGPVVGGRGASGTWPGSRGSEKTSRSPAHRWFSDKGPGVPESRTSTQDPVQLKSDGITDAGRAFDGQGGPECSDLRGEIHPAGGWDTSQVAPRLSEASRSGAGGTMR